MGGTVLVDNYMLCGVSRTRIGMTRGNKESERREGWTKRKEKERLAYHNLWSRTPPCGTCR